MNVLLIDAYDSFVFIIDQYLKALGLRTTVLRCDDPRVGAWIEAGRADMVLLGPGPGRPEAAGYPQLIHRVGGRVPVLGVCLGHQAIGLAFGGAVDCAEHTMHGKTSMVLNDGKGVFQHTGGRPIEVTRYHSLIIRSSGLPPELVVTARAVDDGYIMGVRHRTLPIEGVQFHPESIATENGLAIFRSFLASYAPVAPRQASSA